MREVSKVRGTKKDKCDLKDSVSVLNALPKTHRELAYPVEQKNAFNVELG